MPDFFASPRLADLILAVLALEALVLAVRYARTGRGPSLAAAGPFLLSGACLVLALRAVLAGAAWPWVAGGLTGALVAHLWDLRGRVG
jgi:hypothetical protein